MTERVAAKVTVWGRNKLHIYEGKLESLRKHNLRLSTMYAFRKGGSMVGTADKFRRVDDKTSDQLDIIDNRLYELDEEMRRLRKERYSLLEKNWNKFKRTVLRDIPTEREADNVS